MKNLEKIFVMHVMKCAKSVSEKKKISAINAKLAWNIISILIYHYALKKLKGIENIFFKLKLR